MLGHVGRAYFFCDTQRHHSTEHIAPSVPEEVHVRGGYMDIMASTEIATSD